MLVSVTCSRLYSCKIQKSRFYAGFFCCYKKVLCAKIFVMKLCVNLFLVFAFMNVFTAQVVFAAYDDYTVNANENITTDISLTGNTILYNHGQINANINTNGHSLYIHNFGTINGNIDSGSDMVKQVIDSVSEFNKINVNGNNFIIEISNLNEVDVNGIKNLGANKFIIRNSFVSIDDFKDWQNWGDTVELADTNTLYINNSYTVQSGEFIKHFVDGTNIVLRDSDKLHKVTITKEPMTSAYFIHISRETDYNKIFGDNRGKLLENLRASNPNHSLLLAMDSANNLSELNAAMNKSYRFNTSILNRPVKTINNFSMIDFIPNINALYSGFSAFYIMSDKTNAYGFDINVNDKYEDFYLGFGFQIRKFSYEDEFNDFGGFIYGLNLKAKTYIDNLWLNGVVGFSIINYDTDDLYSDGEIKTDPMGHLWYGTLDAGYDYTLVSDLILSPFVGINGAQYTVLSFKETETNIRAGANLKYSFILDGIKYVYSGIAGVNTNSDIFGGMNIGFVSEQDNAGISFDVNAIKSDEDIDYKFSINIKVTF